MANLSAGEKEKDGSPSILSLLVKLRSHLTSTIGYCYQETLEINNIIPNSNPTKFIRDSKELYHILLYGGNDHETSLASDLWNDGNKAPRYSVFQRICASALELRQKGLAHHANALELLYELLLATTEKAQDKDHWPKNPEAILRVLLALAGTGAGQLDSCDDTIGPYSSQLLAALPIDSQENKGASTSIQPKLFFQKTELFSQIDLTEWLVGSSESGGWVQAMKERNPDYAVHLRPKPTNNAGYEDYLDFKANFSLEAVPFEQSLKGLLEKMNQVPSANPALATGYQPSETQNAALFGALQCGGNFSKAQEYKEAKLLLTLPSVDLREPTNILTRINHRSERVEKFKIFSETSNRFLANDKGMGIIGDHDQHSSAIARAGYALKMRSCGWENQAPVPDSMGDETEKFEFSPAPLLTQESWSSFESCYSKYVNEHNAKIFLGKKIEDMILLACQGVESALFARNKLRFTMVVTSHNSVRIKGQSSKNLASLLNEIALTGSYFLRLDHFVKVFASTAERGQVIQAFATGIQHQLNLFRAWLLETTKKISPHQDGIQPSEDYADPSHIAKLCGELIPHRERLKFLADLCWCTESRTTFSEDFQGEEVEATVAKHSLEDTFRDFPVGSELLNYLHDSILIHDFECNMGLPSNLALFMMKPLVENEFANRAVLFGLFRRAAQPYLNLLFQWVYQGDLKVKHNLSHEFPISCKESFGGDNIEDIYYMKEGGSEFLEKGFHYHTSSLPKFLQGEIGTQIMKTGKLMKMLQLSDPKLYNASLMNSSSILELALSPALLKKQEGNIEVLSKQRSSELDKVMEEKRLKLLQNQLVDRRQAQQRITNIQKEKEAIQNLEKEKQDLQAKVAKRKSELFETLKQQRDSAKQRREEQLQESLKLDIGFTGLKGLETDGIDEDLKREAEILLHNKYDALIAGVEERMAEARWRHRHTLRLAQARQDLGALYEQELKAWTQELLSKPRVNQLSDEQAMSPILPILPQEQRSENEADVHIQSLQVTSPKDALDKEKQQIDETTPEMSKGEKEESLDSIAEVCFSVLEELISKCIDTAGENPPDQIEESTTSILRIQKHPSEESSSLQDHKLDPSFLGIRTSKLQTQNHPSVESSKSQDLKPDPSFSGIRTFQSPDDASSFPDQRHSSVESSRQSKIKARPYFSGIRTFQSSSDNLIFPDQSHPSAASTSKPQIKHVPSFSDIQSSQAPSGSLSQTHDMLNYTTDEQNRANESTSLDALTHDSDAGHSTSLMSNSLTKEEDFVDGESEISAERSKSRTSTTISVLEGTSENILETQLDIASKFGMLGLADVFDGGRDPGYDDKGLVIPLDILINKSICEPIQRQCQVIDEVCFAYLVSECSIYKHFEALKDFMLVSEGLFLQEFLRRLHLGLKRRPQVNWLLSRNLQDALSDALDCTHLQRTPFVERFSYQSTAEYELVRKIITYSLYGGAAAWILGAAIFFIGVILSLASSKSVYSYCFFGFLCIALIGAAALLFLWPVEVIPRTSIQTLLPGDSMNITQYLVPNCTQSAVGCNPHIVFLTERCNLVLAEGNSFTGENTVNWQSNTQANCEGGRCEDCSVSLDSTTGSLSVQNGAKKLWSSRAPKKTTSVNGTYAASITSAGVFTITKGNQSVVTVAHAPATGVYST